MKAEPQVRPSSVGVRNTGGAGARGSTTRRVDRVWASSLAILVLPFGVALLRLATSRGPIFLGGDLAVIDLQVRRALGFHQLLGPYSRYGWSHPGPLYFYLLSVLARVAGAGARTDFIGALLINALSALGVVWVVRSRAGSWASLWAATCMAVLAIAFVGGVVNPGATPLMNPWNPYVVTFPLVLLGVLCALGAAGSWLGILGACLIGSFAVQTDVSTAPLVVALLAGTLVVRLVTATATRRRVVGTAPADGAEHRRRLAKPDWGIVAAAAALVLVWVPTLVQQVTGKQGNIAAIWRFFTGPNSHNRLSSALWSVATIERGLVTGVPRAVNGLTIIGGADPYALIVAGLVVILGVGALAAGIRLHDRFIAFLGGASLVGSAVSVYAATRISGPIFGYLVMWELAAPLLALIGAGMAVLAWGERPGRSIARSRRNLLPFGAVALVACGTFSVEMGRLQPLSSFTDTDVELAVRAVTTRVPSRQPMFLGEAGAWSFGTVATFAGVFDSLDQRGYQLFVDEGRYERIFGRFRRTGRSAADYVVLYPPGPAARTASPQAVRTRTAVVVVSSSPASGLLFASHDGVVPYP